MTPLIQSDGGGIEGYKLQAITGLSKSLDPQIRAWAALRSAQKEKSQVDRHANRLPFQKDFKDSLFKAYKDSGLFNNIMTSLQSQQNNSSQSRGQNHKDTTLPRYHSMMQDLGSKHLTLGSMWLTTSERDVARLFARTICHCAIPDDLAIR